MNVLITGYKGYLGRILYKHLSEKHKCMGADKSTHFDQILAFEPRIVYHLAWIGYPKIDTETKRKNLAMHLRYFRLFSGMGSLRRVIIAGTGAEKNPESEYGSFKRMIYEMAAIMIGKKVVNARIHYIYGHDTRESSLSMLLKKDPLISLEAPFSIRNYVDHDKVLQMLEQCMTTDKDIVDIRSNQEICNYEFQLEMIRRYLDAA